MSVVGTSPVFVSSTCVCSAMLMAKHCLACRPVVLEASCLLLTSSSNLLTRSTQSSIFVAGATSNESVWLQSVNIYTSCTSRELQDSPSTLYASVMCSRAISGCWRVVIGNCKGPTVKLIDLRMCCGERTHPHRLSNQNGTYTLDRTTSVQLSNLSACKLSSTIDYWHRM